jgi:SAM-dependent methyltransferase
MMESSMSSEASASAYHASDGTAYELFLGRWTKVLAPPLLDFAGLPSDGPLLDVGTGTGSLAFAMAARWPQRQISGVDIAEPYIAYAQSQAAGPSPAFETGDVTALRFQDNAFSGAAAQLVLNFVPDAKAAISEMNRVTRPDGTVAAAVWDFRGGLVFQRLLWDTAAGIDPQAGLARDRLFAGALALPRAHPATLKLSDTRSDQDDSAEVRDQTDRPNDRGYRARTPDTFSLCFDNPSGWQNKRNTRPCEFRCGTLACVP